MNDDNKVYAKLCPKLKLPSQLSEKLLGSSIRRHKSLNVRYHICEIQFSTSQRIATKFCSRFCCTFSRIHAIDFLDTHFRVKGFNLTWRFILNRNSSDDYHDVGFRTSPCLLKMSTISSELSENQIDRAFTEIGENSHRSH